MKEAAETVSPKAFQGIAPARLGQLTFYPRRERSKRVTYHRHLAFVIYPVSLAMSTAISRFFSAYISVTSARACPRAT